jgi:hypothetical protein
MTSYVDAWTVQAVMASRWLTRLYRALGDDHQASTAINAGARASERLDRLRLHDRVGPMEEGFNRDYPDQTLGEEAAWTALVEAQAGLASFFALTDTTSEKPAPGLRGARTATFAAYRRAIQGFHTAFPDPMAKKGVDAATQKAMATCVEAFMVAIEDGDHGQREQLRVDLEACVLDALERAIGAEG